MTGPLENWYDNGGVRATPRRTVREDLEAGLLPFPPGLVPYLAHPALAGSPAQLRQQVLARHLYQYLLFTVHLETKVVNRGVALIIHGELDMDVPVRTRLDAAKIYCDEGYHALYNLDLLDQIAAMTGIPMLEYSFDARLDRLARTSHRHLPEHPQLAHLLQVVAFETVVTAMLAQIPRDPTVYRVVRDVVGDHARDEAVHHAFFTSFFRELWAALPPRLRGDVARSMPHFINDCIRPDLEPIRASLVAAGVASGVADGVLAESYPEHAVRRMVWASGRYALRLCESVGAFDLPGARDELEALGLAGTPPAAGELLVVP